MADASRFSMHDALIRQRDACAVAGSPLYATVLDGVADDHRRGGVTAELLDGVSAQPVHDAVPLRYLATVHRLALAGAAPELAVHYPSCGGAWNGDAAVVDAFLDAVRTNHDELVAGLRRNVQTNEVGRAAVLASGFAWIGEQHGLAVDQLEIGSSAGLLSRWDRFGYDTGATRCGDPDSPVRFGTSWWADGRPDLTHTPAVVRRRASDVSPVDVSGDEGRTTMTSFVWPDQTVRIDRLRAALDVAAALPVAVERADAGEWLGRELAVSPSPGVATVVFHSIVWQYLPTSTRDAVRAAITAAGERATATAPVCWMRMEPANPAHADLRVTTWPGGETVHLADVGYHGADIRWAPGNATPAAE